MNRYALWLFVIVLSSGVVIIGCKRADRSASVSPGERIARCMRIPPSMENSLKRQACTSFEENGCLLDTGEKQGDTVACLGGREDF